MVCGHVFSEEFLDSCGSAFVSFVFEGHNFSLLVEVVGNSRDLQVTRHGAAIQARPSEQTTSTVQNLHTLCVRGLQTVLCEKTISEI